MRNAKFLIVVILLALHLGCSANQSDAPATHSTARTIAPDPIPDLPDYPGATRTAYTAGEDMRGGFSKTVRVELTTTDASEKVIDFYGRAYKDNGWKPLDITSSSGEGETGMTINLSKGTSVARITISQKNRGNVTVTIDRKDK